jgi:hypothetical protein
MESMKTTSSKIFFVLSVLLAFVGRSQAQAQTTVVAIQDTSAADSPLKIAGHVSIQEDSTDISMGSRFSMDAALTNTSSKPIMTYHILLDIKSASSIGEDAEYGDDRFFGDEMIAQPGSTVALTEDWSPWHSTPIKKNARPNRSTAEVNATVVFVQFADGSRFGDDKWATRLRADRNTTIASLALTLKTYQGGTSVSEAIKNVMRSTNPEFTSVHSTVLYRLKGLSDSEGSGAALAELQKFLANSDKRKAHI